MSDHRQMEQDLVELALGEVPEPRRSELLTHLTGCLRCRTTYSEIVAAIDATVPAAPETQPPAGFDLRVLGALGIGAEHDSPVRRLVRRSPRRVMLAAAAVTVLVVGGGVGVASLLDEPGDQAPTVAAVPPDTVALRKGDGEQVGTAAVAWMDSDRVIVVAVSKAPVGVRYTCQVSLAEGGNVELGHWEAASAQGGTWVMTAPQGDLNYLQLVTDSGQVWATAPLH